MSNVAISSEQIDVLIIGAGISGIDVAYRVSERCPELHVVIVEARERLGGTWDLFRYPGVRSDSDFFTLAFPFHPWRGKNTIVDGREILEYLDEVVDAHHLRSRIRCGTRVLSLDWLAEQSRWRVQCVGPDGEYEIRARFVVGCTGYYDYEHPYDPGLPGLNEVAAKVLHPQFWPGGLDYRGKSVAVVGSGATAVSLVPALVDGGAKVTLVQRTPSYVLARRRRDPLARVLRRALPAGLAHRVLRTSNTLVQVGFYQFCRRAPQLAGRYLRSGVRSGVGSSEIADSHFAPPYRPWDQRLCIAPDGDYFRVIREGACTIVTGEIDTVTPHGLRMVDGRTVDTDLIVTATGLSIQVFGGIELRVDGEAVDPASRFVYRGAMISDMPNLAFCVGYVNLSWTMRADLTARLIARILRQFLDQGADQVTARAGDNLGPGRPILKLSSGYLTRAASLLPRVSEKTPWTMEQNYLRDAWQTNRARISEELEWRHSSRHLSV